MRLRPALPPRRPRRPGARGLQPGTPFDVVLIDVKGLGYDGVKLAAKIRGTPGARTEVILLVGLDGSVADASVEKVGAYALLTKPARP